MNYKKFYILVILLLVNATQGIHGAWNPSDLRGSLVISTITKADFLDPYEIGECSDIKLYENSGVLPNKPEYQTPYVLYYAAPPLANIKALFKNNKLKVRPAQLDQCTSEDTEPFFTIELPENEPNQLKIVKQMGTLGTYITILHLDKLQNYLQNKESYLYLKLGKPFSFYKGNPWDTLKRVIPQEQNGYFYTYEYDGINPQLTFVEVSINLAIDYVPANYNLGGFGYIPNVKICHVIVQPKILDLLKLTSSAQFIGLSKTPAFCIDAISLNTLITEGIVQQFLE